MRQAAAPVCARNETLNVSNLRGLVNGPFDLQVDSGQCVAIAGPSGIGKSLLLRMIADLDVNQGEVSIGHQARAAMPAPAWRRRVTYVAAESGWWGEHVAEHLTQPQRVREFLAVVGLRADILAAPVAQLSSGERQRLALLRAISQQPQFLLLDEPTSALDASSMMQVEALLRQLKQDGTGLLLVSHDPAQIARLADRVFQMSHNGLTEQQQ